MRKAIIAVASILLLGGGAVAAIYALSGSAPASRDAPVTLEPPQQQPGALTLPPLPGTNPAAPQGPAVSLPSAAATQQLEVGPPAVRAPKGTWEAVPAAARASGAVGRALGTGISTVQPRLTACFSETAQAQHGQDKLSETPQDYASAEDTGTGILVLNIETSREEIRIVDAPVEARGGFSDGLIACYQGVLRGRTFPAPGVQPGQRLRLLHTITP
jgi:hypothetical protein